MAHLFKVAEGILDDSENIDINLSSWQAVDTYASNGCGIELTRGQCEKVLSVCREYLAADSNRSHDYFFMVEQPLS